MHLDIASKGTLVEIILGPYIILIYSLRLWDLQRLFFPASNAYFIVDG